MRYETALQNCVTKLRDNTSLQNCATALLVPHPSRRCASWSRFLVAPFGRAFLYRFLVANFDPLQVSTPGYGLRDGDAIRVFQIAADGQPPGEPGNPHAQWMN